RLSPLFPYTTLFRFSAACGKSTTSLAPSPVGAYVLTSVDQRSLPTSQSAGDSILAGGAILYANGAYAINWLAPTYYFRVLAEIADRKSTCLNSSHQI